MLMLYKGQATPNHIFFSCNNKTTDHAIFNTHEIKIYCKVTNR